MDSDCDGLVNLGDMERKFNVEGFSLSRKEVTSIFSLFEAKISKSISVSTFTQTLYQLHSSGNSDASLSLQAEEALWSFLEPSSLPPYLQQNVQQRILKKTKNISDKIHWHLGPLDKLVTELGEKFGPFDVIQTSNVTDWISPSQCSELLKNCHKFLTPGGAVIARRLNGDYDLSSVVKQHFSIDSTLQQKLLREDRSFFYSELVIGKVQYE